MPRIDDINIKRKSFKKKQYRSWDNNLLENLKIKSDNNTKGKSADDQTESKQGLTKAQTESNKSSDTVQQEANKRSNKVQLVSKKESNKVLKESLNKVQLEFTNEVDTIRTLIKKLGGNEKKIFFYVIDICAIKGTLDTDEILGKTIDAAINTTRNGRETAIKRLVKKGLLIRNKGKTGAHGTLNLSVSELIKTEALNFLHLQESFEQLLRNKGSTRVQHKPVNKAHLGFTTKEYINSSSNITTNENNKKIELPEEWLNINFDLLIDIGFSLTQIEQLYSRNLTTPEIVQESIHHFAYGLENNSKVKQYSNPLNVLMGVLRKGQAWFEQNYQSPQEIAQRQLLEKKKREREKLKQLEEEAYNLAFEQWQETLTENEVEQIAPAKKKGVIAPQQVRLSMHFRGNIWPDLKHEYLVGG